MIATFASDAGLIPPPDSPLAAPIVTLIPEPSVVLLVGVGVWGLSRWSRRRGRAA